MTYVTVPLIINRCNFRDTTFVSFLFRQLKRHCIQHKCVARDFVTPGTTADFIPLHLNVAGVAALPTKCSRHNSPSQPHALYNVLKSWDPPSAAGGDVNERHIVVSFFIYRSVTSSVYFTC